MTTLTIDRPADTARRVMGHGADAACVCAPISEAGAMPPHLQGLGAWDQGLGQEVIPGNGRVWDPVEVVLRRTAAREEQAVLIGMAAEEMLRMNDFEGFRFMDRKAWRIRTRNIKTLYAIAAMQAGKIMESHGALVIALEGGAR